MAANPFADYQKRFTTWLDDQTERDRKFLLVGAITIALILLYLLAWKPSYAYATKAEKHFADSEELLDFVRQNEARLREVAGTQGANAGQALDTQSFMSAVTTSAQRHKIALSRIEPAGDQRLRVAVDKAAFNDVIRWLEQLAESSQITIDQIAVDRAEVEGVVNVRVTLEI